MIGGNLSTGSIDFLVFKHFFPLCDKHVLLPWQQIVETNVRGLVVYVRRLVGNDHDAEDIVQEVFAEAYRLSSTTAVENWSALLFRIAQRRSIDHLRRLARRAGEVHNDEISELAATHADPAECLDAIERDGQLRLALTHLSTREASVFSLAYFERMPRSEIASLLETSINAVNLAIHKAIQKLRVQLEPQSSQAEPTDES